MAGGFGTRLLPLTARRPKHLLDVGGVPFLEHQIARLAEAGVDHVVLATSYHADMFAPVLGDGSRWGIRLDYVLEEEPLGTGGAIRNVAGALGDDPDGAVVILNGDVLSGHDLPGQLEDFDTPRDGRRVDVSLHLVAVDGRRGRSAACRPTTDGRVLAFVEKSDDPVDEPDQRRLLRLPPRRHRHHPGRPGGLGGARDVPRAGRRRAGWWSASSRSAYWRDVGTPEALVAASRDVVLGIAPTPAIDAAPPARVDPSAEVGRARSTAAAWSWRGRGSADGATVTGSVVMTGARVEGGARVTDSVVGPGAVVGADAVLDGVTLGDDARVAAGAVPDPGTRVDCGATHP